MNMPNLLSKYYLSLAVLMLCAFLMQGCGEKKVGEGVGKFGTMDESTAEYSATKFFDHLYNTKDVNELLRYSSPKMSRLIRSYRSSSNIQRHVINLRFDEVQFEINSSRNVGLTKYADTARLSVYFNGKLHGEKVEDLRTVNLIRHAGKWKVESVQDDKYRPNY
jgi:hypothetical protein